MAMPYAADALNLPIKDTIIIVSLSFVGIRRMQSKHNAAMMYKLPLPVRRPMTIRIGVGIK